MSGIKSTEKFLPTLPPQSASPQLREWLREEFDRIALSSNAALTSIDVLRAVPRMFLAGDVDNIILDVIPVTLQNYTQFAAIGVVPVEPDPIAGTITIPLSGLYRVTVYIAGDQPSVTQNEQIRLLVGVNSVDVPIVVMDVATNQTDTRTFAATLARDFVKGDVLTMSMDATADMGAFLFFQVSFELELLILVDGTPAGQRSIDWFP